MTESDLKFQRAMAASDDLLSKLRDRVLRSHPLLNIFANMWPHRNNMHAVTTVYEAFEEMAAPLQQMVNGKLKH